MSTYSISVRWKQNILKDTHVYNNKAQNIGGKYFI